MLVSRFDVRLVQFRSKLSRSAIMVMADALVVALLLGSVHVCGR
jgi:uncharacterized membrane protein affecting hemolysin expression